MAQIINYSISRKKEIRFLELFNTIFDTPSQIYMIHRVNYTIYNLTPRMQYTKLDPVTQSRTQHSQRACIYARQSIRIDTCSTSRSSFAYD